MSQPKITIDNVWSNKTDELIQEIIEFWNERNAIPPTEDIDNRAKQVVVVARNEEKQVIGVTTAYPVNYKPLRSNFFAFRGLIKPEYRIPGLFIKMTTESFSILEDFSKGMHEQERPIGVIAEVENPTLRNARMTKTSSGMVLAGFSKKGNPIYVYYFKGSRFS